MIDFWGTWCGPCRLMLPRVQRLYERYRGRGVQFMTIAVEFEPADTSGIRDKVAAFVKDSAYTFPVVLDPQGAQTEPLYVPAMPTTWVLDPRGHVRFQNAGFFDGVDEVVTAQIESLLSGQRARSGKPQRGRAGADD